MEQLDDSHYLTEPDDPERCELHDCPRPCQACRYEERD